MTSKSLTIQEVLVGAAMLRQQRATPHRGAYTCYLDNPTILGLFQDGDFKYLFRGAYGPDAYQVGSEIELLGIRFTPTDNTSSLFVKGLRVYRAILCGEEGLAYLIR